MKQPEINYWITAMLKKHDRVSDLNITVGKTLQVESDGQLVPVEVQPPVTELTPFQTEVFALNLVGGNRRLLRDLVTKGSCDLSYSARRQGPLPRQHLLPERLLHLGAA